MRNRSSANPSRGRRAQLDRDFAVEVSIHSNRAIDVTHAPAANFLHELIVANTSADPRDDCCSDSGHRVEGRGFQRVGLHELGAGLLVGSQQRFDVASQIGIVGAGAVQVKRRAAVSRFTVSSKSCLRRCQRSAFISALMPVPLRC